MERIKMTKNSLKYGFKKGDEYIVKRTIMNECVIIRNPPDCMNLIWSEKKCRYYGELTGNPQLCFS